MIREALNGFCMALADSVPGVSGGTVAFIMGFYDRFIGAIHDMVFGDMKKKKGALVYLLKLGTGWTVGMILAVLVLAAMFEREIYLVSSLFIGFVAGSIPLIIREERESFKRAGAGCLFLLAGLLLVAGITWMNGRSQAAFLDLGQFHLGLGVCLFFIGMVAISAMFLPGISGSTLLLIFGAYIPVITAVKGILGLDFSYLPALLFFGSGILAGAATIVKGIQICLDRFRPQSLYAILGMMVGSLYAIIQGPETLEFPQAPLGVENFSLPACLVGIILVLGLQKIKERREKAS